MLSVIRAECCIITFMMGAALLGTVMFSVIYSECGNFVVMVSVIMPRVMAPFEAFTIKLLWEVEVSWSSLIKPT